MGLFNSIRLGASSAGDYEVERSLRFNDGDDANLSRTPSSAGNTRTWTFSAWLKLGQLGTIRNIFSRGTTAALPWFFSYLNSDNTLQIYFINSGGTSYLSTSNKLFRDNSAWYHFVIRLDTTQSTSTDRLRVYVNNELITWSSYQAPSQNFESEINTTALHNIGRHGGGNPFDGYMAEINHVDGLSLDPSSFAETDAITGQWNPKKYVGSYGTNGFYLNFSDNSGTTATTLGKDSSGNGNNFTPNNFVTGDAVKDSPTNNFATLMIAGTPKASGCSLKEGNLEFETGTTGSGGNGNRLPFNTISPTSGKWYVEVMPTTTDSIFIGVHTYQVEIVPTSGSTRWQGLYSYNGESYLASTSSTASNSTYAASYGNNDVIGIYMDMDASPPQVYFAKNGQWANGSGSWNQSTPTGAITLGGTFFTTSTGGFEGIGINIRSASSSTNTSAQANFGQDSTFSGRISAGGNVDASGIGDFKYTVPTNALALCSANLPDPTIKLPNKHFDTLLYTGTGSSNSITGLNFAPNWTWIKSRSLSSTHKLMDSVRGDGLTLASNNTNAEASDSSIFSSLDSSGFTVTGTANSTNASSATYVGWNWNAGGGSTVTNTDGTISTQVRANPTAGFSIVTYTGTGSAGTIGHGLGVVPDTIITKTRNATGNWTVYNKNLDHASSTSHRVLRLNNTAAQTGSSALYYGNDPTSSVQHLAAYTDSNQSSETYVAYCFSEVAGYSKFGSYTGNGNADGTFVFTGFRPVWVLIKNSSSGSTDWILKDATIDTFNVMNKAFKANTNDAEFASLTGVDFLSNGFKIRNNGSFSNTSGNTYIYLAFAESPFKNSRAR